MTETANYGAQPTSGDAAVPADVENFFDKYSRGMRIVVEGAQADTGQTPKETVWTKNKAKLYHYADRKSTRLNSSHANISYAVFCLKNKTPKSTSAHH